MTRRTLILGAAVLLAATACSSRTSSGTSSSGEAEQCAIFDAGASDLPAQVTALSGGTTPRHAISDLANAVYNMSQASRAGAVVTEARSQDSGTLLFAQYRAARMAEERGWSTRTLGAVTGGLRRVLAGHEGGPITASAAIRLLTSAHSRIRVLEVLDDLELLEDDRDVSTRAWIERAGAAGLGRLGCCELSGQIVM